ncbi:hypothetical protein M2323_000274 [Rhodoblastus acidophilus]|uniref:hypothetical protein n=1 Tax=Rhodoblastus acidophilus TaxID=1074 RepID=UPI0022249DC5|nr:hypothetical protein [Rhodoblastus acidophilus]MCW2282513.1 hypothetical protein [Rhodoblastus acidophilus]MCW2331374.1 hypothetical protein [Rhodoblastus acidophilus]
MVAILHAQRGCKRMHAFSTIDSKDLWSYSHPELKSSAREHDPKKRISGFWK